MQLVLHRTVEYKTYTHDFGNGFVFVQNWANKTITDEFFVHYGDLYPDGSVKKGKKKYFYSPYDPPNATKEVGQVKVSKFKWFDRLFYVDGNGEVKNINE